LGGQQKKPVPASGQDHQKWKNGIFTTVPKTVANFENGDREEREENEVSAYPFNNTPRESIPLNTLIVTITVESIDHGEKSEYLASHGTR